MSEDGVGVEAKFLEVMSTKSFCCYRYIIFGDIRCRVATLVRVE